MKIKNVINNIIKINTESKKTKRKHRRTKKKTNMDLLRNKNTSSLQSYPSGNHTIFMPSVSNDRPYNEPNNVGLLTNNINKQFGLLTNQINEHSGLLKDIDTKQNNNKDLYDEGIRQF